MIGDRDFRVTFPRSSSPALVSRAFRIAQDQGTRRFFGTRLKGDILDDHIPFRQRGIEVINFIDFEFGPGNAYWHTPEDTLDKLSAESLEIVGNVALQLIYELAEDAQR
jgi:Zn-dependent M28 family amino/carboxypeptidase